MNESLIWATGLVLFVSAIIAYAFSRDPLHPMSFISPMLFYIYVLIPGATFYSEDSLTNLFPDQEALQAALAFTLLSVLFFSIGCLSHRLPRPRMQMPRRVLDSKTRRRLANVGYLLGAIGLGVFLYRVALSGGLFRVYSRPKGGAASLFSGYLTVAPLLTIPGMLLLLLSHHGQRYRASFLFTLLIMISPHLIQGLLGGSRGPAFLALGSLFFGWFIIRSRTPSLRVALAVLLGTGILMLFLKEHRQQLYIGAEETAEIKGVNEFLIPEAGQKDHAGIYSLGGIAAVRHHSHYLWGKGFAVQLFVRAIPRQIWPNKYQDVGMGWMVTQPGSLGMTSDQWRRAVGWEPNAGAASGFVLNTFFEFGWAGCFIAWMVGWFYGWLWKRSILDHGVWALLYAEACIVSVYLPTQGLISAWGYRFLYLAVPTVILWRLVSTTYNKHSLSAQTPPPKITTRIIRAMQREKRAMS